MWSDPTIVTTETKHERSPAYRNVLLISIDTLRADHLGSYGYARPTSPFLDALAAQGAVFDRAYSPFPQTAGGHMTMLTGLEPCAHGVIGPSAAPLPESVATLAELLRGAGYETAAITEDGWITFTTGFARGFGHFVEQAGEGLSEGLAEQTFDAAAAWIEAQQVRPWFVFVHTYQVHEPYDPPDGYWERLGGDPGVALQDIDRYDAEIRYMDDIVSRFVARVDARPGGDATVVVVTSDHGELFGEHGLHGHDNSLYEPVLHVPLIIRAPEVVEPRTRIGDRVGLIDLAPTVLDLVGIAAPAGMQGRSMMPLLRGHNLPLRPLFAEWRQKVARYDDDTKWIIDLNSGHATGFDLASDPNEENGVTVQLSPQRLASLLAVHRRRCATRGRTAGPAALQPGVQRRLKELGYLD